MASSGGGERVRGRFSLGWRVGVKRVVARPRLALLVGAVIALSAGAARASATLVQNNTATGTTSVAATWGLAGGVTAGHLLVATVAAASGSTLGAPAGWTLITSVDNSTKVMVAMYYIQNCPAKAQNTTETFTATGSNGTTLRLMEFSGVATASSLDVSGTATGGTNTPPSVSTSAVVTTSPELGVAIIAHQADDASNLTPSAPYSNVGSDTTTSVNVEDTVYDTSVASGGLSTAAAIVSGTAHSWAAVIATFQEAPLYWRGALTGCATGSLFTSTTCWSTSTGGSSAGVAPGMSDRALFDGHGTGNCALSSTVTTQTGSITTTSAYTGTITQGTKNVSLSSDLSIGGGTFTGRPGQTIATNQSGTYTGGIVVSGGAFNGNGAALAIESLFVSGGTFTAGSGTFSTNNGGDVVLTGGASTFSSGTVSLADTLTVSGASTSATFGSGAPTVTGLTTLSGGTVTFGSGQLTLNGGLDVEGASVTLGSSALTTTVMGTATLGSGTVNFTNGSAGTDFSNTLAFTQSGGTVNMNGATVELGSTITTGSNDAFTMTGGTFDNTTAGGALSIGESGGGGGVFNQSGSGAIYNGASTATETFNGPLQVSGAMNVGNATMAGTGVATRQDVTINAGGTMTLSSAGFAFTGPTAMTIAGTLDAGTGTATFNPVVVVSGALDGSSGTQHFADALTVSGTLKTGAASMTGGSAATELVAISAGGTMTLSSPGFAFDSTTSMPIAGTLNAGGGTVTFAGPVALTGRLNADGATTTVTGALSMAGTSAFDGNTGTTTFTAAPTLTAGTFTVGDAAATGSVIFSAGATFASGMTLAFPTSGGTLSAPGGQSLAIDGTVTSSAGAASTPPKIARSSGAEGITISFGSTSVLNVNGLEFDDSVATGVSIASGATYTLLRQLKFQNNVGGAGSTHLAITLTTALINVPGCFFDGTATLSVTLFGTMGAAGGARATFEDLNAATNGATAGELHDKDGDTNDDNAGDSTGTAPYYGSVIEWVGASATDTSGVAIGSPTPAFDWNTFAFYGIYVAYKNATGAGTPDVLWVRHDDGSPARSYAVAQSSGDIVGTPWWDTVNETTAHVDANGDGDQTDTDVHVVYMGTTLGHIIKLVDNGATLAPPSAGPWSTPFTSASVATISSPLADDGTNLYFGGTDGSAATKAFGVQVAGGVNEKTLQKNIGAVSAITAAPSWAVYSGSTYVFLGSTATAGQAFIYRVNMSAGSINASFSGVTTSVNGSVVLMANNSRAYAVTDGGTLHVLDAATLTVGAFKNLTGFPYQSAAASPIKAAPYVDYKTSNSYFGDNTGKLYVVTSTGTNLPGYPFSLGSLQVTSAPAYLSGGGVIAVGASDGYLYFVDRNSGSNVPKIFRRYFVTSAGAISSVSYDFNTSEYMVSSSDGKLMFVNGTDVVDPTSAVE